MKAFGAIPMSRYVATLDHGETGGEGKYEFDAPDSLLGTTPVRAVRKFMESLDFAKFPNSYIDYELNAAMRSGRDDVVTAMGAFIMENDDRVPFLIMISEKQ